MCLNYSVLCHHNLLVSDTKLTTPPMKYADLPMFIPLIAGIYLMTVYAVLKIAESQCRTNLVSSNKSDTQQIEVNS